MVVRANANVNWPCSSKCKGCNHTQPRVGQLSSFKLPLTDNTGAIWQTSTARWVPVKFLGASKAVKREQASLQETNLFKQRKAFSGNGWNCSSAEAALQRTCKARLFYRRTTCRCFCRLSFCKILRKQAVKDVSFNHQCEQWRNLQRFSAQIQNFVPQRRVVRTCEALGRTCNWVQLSSFTLDRAHKLALSSWSASLMEAGFQSARLATSAPASPSGAG